MSAEEWPLFEYFILAIRAPNDPKPTNHRLVLDGMFGSQGQVPRGVISPKSSANGQAFIGSFDDGHWPGCGKTLLPR